MPWYVWLIIILVVLFVFVLVMAAAKANAPFRELDDQEQIEYLENLKKKKE